MSSSNSYYCVSCESYFNIEEYILCCCCNKLLGCVNCVEAKNLFSFKCVSHFGYSQMTFCIDCNATNH